MHHDDENVGQPLSSGINRPPRICIKCSNQNQIDVGPAKSGQAKPRQAKLSQAKPSQAKPCYVMLCYGMASENLLLKPKT